MKEKLDHDIKLNLKYKDLQGHVSIITGGNSGIGLEVAKQLVGLGSTVIIACRSQVKCRNAATLIQMKYPLKKDLIVTMTLDLSDLASVKKFADDVNKQFKRLDILVNNAGLLASPGDRTVQGLEKSFGVMHIGHFALTKWLLKLMLKPLPSTNGLQLTSTGANSARIVTVASDAMLIGNFDPSFMVGSGVGDLNCEVTDNCGKRGPFECCPILPCPVTNGYARAKLANVMFTYELQRRVDALIESTGGKAATKKYRRLVTSSLHPGVVHTNIHPFLQSQTTSYFLRSAEAASHVVLHAILEDSFIPSSFIDSMKRSHDLFQFGSTSLSRHKTIFPHVDTMPFITASLKDNTNNTIKKRIDEVAKYGLHPLVWRSKSLIVSSNTTTGTSNSTTAETIVYRKEEVSARLWDVSERVVDDWLNSRPLLSSRVSTKPVNQLKL